MLEKTMKKVLNTKIKKWLSTITDDAVKEVIKKDLIITGGCFTSMIDNQPVNDLDCYFRTKKTVLKVAQYYVDVWNKNHKQQLNKMGKTIKAFVLNGANPSQELLDWYHIKSLQDSKAVMIYNTSADRVKLIIPSDGVAGDPTTVNAAEELGTASTLLDAPDEVPAAEEEKKEHKPYSPVFISANALTLTDQIQLIVRFYGDPAAIHDTYDYEHTKAYYDYGTKELVIPTRVYELTVNKKLVYTGSKYPIASMFRMRKFINRGWNINAGQILKMAMQTSKLDLENVAVLEDQLIGVDSVYFMQLINQFRQKLSVDPSFVLSSSYVMSIVDKVFN